MLEDSPAAEAGIAQGDIILTIEGTPASQLTLATVNERFEKAGSYELTIRRGKQVVRMPLAPRTRKRCRVSDERMNG